jgi:hypothetical protein
VQIEIMHTNKTSSVLAMIAIVTAIALLTAGSITTALAAKKSTSTIGAKSSTSTGSLSKLMGCLKLISGPLTRAQLDQCYNIVYASGNPPVAPVASSTPPPPARLGAGSTSSSTAAP